jgi:transcriptional regulator GlxA family with amidase domain
LPRKDHFSQRKGGTDASVVAFFLLPEFSLLSYASAVEPLRAANQIAGQTLYRWCNIAIDHAPVAASNGVTIVPDQTIEGPVSFKRVIVCAGGNPASFDHKPTINWLRHLSRAGIHVGGVSGGPFILARAGLLNGYRFTLHWEHIPAFTESFPDMHVHPTLFEIDRHRFTCAGGIAALDLMHAIIEQDHGPALAAAVSDWFLHTEIRIGNSSQRVTLRERYNVTNRKLLQVLDYMERHLEKPATRRDLARTFGLSTRHLDRLFATHLRSSFSRHYLGVRLDRAQALLRQTSLPILEIAVACGFTSSSHFSRSYKQRFRATPKSDRQNRTPRDSHSWAASRN